MKKYQKIYAQVIYLGTSDIINSSIEQQDVANDDVAIFKSNANVPMT